MLKAIVVTTKTWCSNESYYLLIDSERSIEKQIETKLDEVGYCDNYEIANIMEVDEEYIKRRKALIEKIKKLDPKADDVLLNIETLEEIEEEVRWVECHITK